MNDPCRRPISDDELPYLRRLGEQIAAARYDAGLSQTGLGRAAEISGNHVYRIEGGRRRTRQSTLQRLAAAIAAEIPDLDADTLADEWQRLAGPALAPESPYADDLDQQRQRRVARQAKRAEQREFWHWRVQQRRRYQAACAKVDKINAQMTAAGHYPPSAFRPAPNPESFGL